MIVVENEFQSQPSLTIICTDDEIILGGWRVKQYNEWFCKVEIRIHHPQRFGVALSIEMFQLGIGERERVRVR